MGTVIRHMSLMLLVEKIMGRSEFKGVSPVDAFCGKEYLKFS